MAEPNKQNNSAAPDSDEALQSFLSRDQEEQKPVKNGGGKINKRVLIVIIAVVAVAALVVLLIFTRSQTASYNEDEASAVADITLDVDENGEHIAKISLDENGNIKENGTGSLLTYVPADISRVDVENTKGSFSVTSTTPEGEATIYTLVGFEDYSLQEGIADDIASDASSVDFIEIISADGNLADFGLDEPRAKIKISFHDDTTAYLRIGNEAPAQAGTYIAFGKDDAVYLVSSDSVDSFMYSVNEFISLAITDAAESSDDSAFTSLTISGTRYEEPITLVPNTDEAIENTYIVTEPKHMYANAIESYDIAGAIRGLYAEEVVCVNPSDSQLESYGLLKPYASVKASYPDAEINLSASEAGEDGKVYIYNPDKDIVYTIQLAAVSWAVTSVEALAPENILNVKLEAVSKIDFKAGDESYSFDVSTTTEQQDDAEGNTEDVSVTTATYNGKELNSDYFHIFFQNLNDIENMGDAGDKGGEVMSFTYTYSTGRDPDTITAYSTGSAKYAIALNGDMIGSASKSYIDSLILDPQALVNDEPVAGL